MTDTFVLLYNAEHLQCGHNANWNNKRFNFATELNCKTASLDIWDIIYCTLLVQCVRRSIVRTLWLGGLSELKTWVLAITQETECVSLWRSGSETQPLTQCTFNWPQSLMYWGLMAVCHLVLHMALICGMIRHSSYHLCLDMNVCCVNKLICGIFMFTSAADC